MPTREEVVLTRRELYELVWTQPVRTLAKQFGMSDVAFAKWCRKLDIPTPGVGYWQKKQFGKKTKKPELPHPNRDDTLRLWRYHFEAGETPVPPPIRDVPEYEAFEHRPENRIVVPKLLTNPHSYVASAVKAFKGGWVDSRYGWVCARLHPCLDIQATQGCLDRALRVMDTLIKSLAARGITVEVAKHAEYKKATTFVLLNGERIGIGLFESPCKGLREDSWSKKMVEGMIPSGRLVLRIRSEWGSDNFQIRDKKTRVVEDRLNDFVIAIYREAIRLKEWRAEQEKRRKDEAERQRREAEERLRREQEAAKLRELETLVANWRKARDIREFLLNLVDACQPEEVVKMQGWINWATAQANRIDPLNLRDEERSAE